MPGCVYVIITGMVFRTVSDHKYIKNEKERQIVLNIQTALHKLVDEYNSIGNDNFVVAHSDCILFNFIFTDRKTYLIDFDNAKVLPRIHDFAEFFVATSSILVV